MAYFSTIIRCNDLADFPYLHYRRGFTTDLAGRSQPLEQTRPFNQNKQPRQLDIYQSYKMARIVGMPGEPRGMTSVIGCYLRRWHSAIPSEDAHE